MDTDYDPPTFADAVAWLGEALYSMPGEAVPGVSFLELSRRVRLWGPARTSIGAARTVEHMFGLRQPGPERPDTHLTVERLGKAAKGRNPSPLGSMLAAARGPSRLTQKELADRLTAIDKAILPNEVADKQMTHFEAGRRRPHPRVLAALCEAYRVDDEVVVAMIKAAAQALENPEPGSSQTAVRFMYGTWVCAWEDLAPNSSPKERRAAWVKHVRTFK